MEDATFAPPPVAELARAQFIAMMECYRRLFFVWCLVPIALLVIPMSVATYLSILDYWTRSALVCTILTLALTVVAVRFIRQRAPSTKAFYGGLQRQGLRIFLCLFTISCVATRMAVAPLLQTIITTSEGSLFQYTTWWLLLDTSMRLAAGAAILGLAVVFRFIGPSSLVRCSTVPLVSQPLSVAIRSAWAKCTSAEALLDLLAGGPSETPGELFSTAQWQKNGRRYQRPTLRATFGHISLATVFATAFGYITILEWYSSSDDTISTATLTCVCILAVLLTLPLDGFSHEGNPKRYWSGSWCSPHDISFMIRTVISASITAPFLSLVMLWFVWREVPQHLVFVITVSTVAAALVSFYLTFLDLFSRRLLFTPGVNIKSLVENIYDDLALESFLAVVLESLMHVDETLIQAVAKCTERRASVVDIEQDEVKRNKLAMERMAHVLLNKNPFIPEAPLEEDMLRFLVLESLGGRRSRGAPIDEIGKRHMRNLMAWIKPKPLDGVGSRYSVEPPTVPLVRALCAVAGGLGEALLRVTVATKVSTFHTDAVRPSWILPPGAVASGEFAITAAARLIVLSVDLSGRGMSDWRSSHLSVLVIATLNAAFRLRSGAVKYASLRHKPAAVVLGDVLAVQYDMATPESLPLLIASDESAKNIMRTLKSFEGGRNVQLALDSDCSKWTTLLLAKDP